VLFYLLILIPFADGGGCYSNVPGSESNITWIQWETSCTYYSFSSDRIPLTITTDSRMTKMLFKCMSTSGTYIIWSAGKILAQSLS